MTRRVRRWAAWIYLPIAVRGRSSGSAAAPALSGGGDETLLVAEDEPAVRAILARSLREYGYTVLEARDGAHALEVAQRSPAPPDMLIATIQSLEVSTIFSRSKLVRTRAGTALPRPAIRTVIRAPLWPLREV